ncbi:MAG: aminoglycoside adenylyltransferase domain-containing protein [Chloroflexota bacterium]
MNPTDNPQINTVLDILLAQMQAILGDKLVGLYLYGSLVTGDFDDTVSDIDLLAALADALDEDEFSALDAMHEKLALDYPERKDRLEIAYLSLHALQTFKTQSSPLGIISPGTPFQIIQAGKEWLMNWYMVLTIGVTLFGPKPDTIIDPISQTEFVEAIKQHVLAWRTYIQNIDSRPGQAYAILTMCRGLYTTRNGEQVSKVRAAQWAKNQLPEWAGLIDNALQWRLAWRDSNADPALTLDNTRGFVNMVIDLVEKSG